MMVILPHGPRSAKTVPEESCIFIIDGAEFPSSRPCSSRCKRRGNRNKGGVMKEVVKFAPFLTFRWWLLHTAAIAAVYAAGQILTGG